MGAFSDLHTQLFIHPPSPTGDFAGQTILVTGSNVGLGKEACKHFIKLGAARVIATVRTTARGAAALKEIEADTKTSGVAELWELDLSKYASVLAFGDKARREFAEKRLDKVVLNAGIATENWEVFEGHESSVLVNVISTTLAACLLLPVLRASAEKFHIEPVLAVVSSGIHAYAKFKERKGKNIFETMDDKEASDMGERYAVSKLVQLFAIREIAARTASSVPFVTVTTTNPGLCYTDLTRSAEGGTKVMMKVMRALMAWSAEEGSRTLVWSTTQGKQSHGAFICGGTLVENKSLSKFVTSPEGQETQERIWGELENILEDIRPGVTAVLK